jgi:hypothetical protein
MNRFFKPLPLLTCLVATSAFAATPQKVKVIDAFNTIDPKTVTASEVKMKIISTPDPAHHKALEMVADFAKPGAWPWVKKMVPPGMMNPKKYSGIRFYAKSDSETAISVIFSGPAGKDGRPLGYAAYIKGTNTWTEVSLPFSSFKNYEVKLWKEGVQKVFKGGEPIADADFPLISAIQFAFDINKRGTATAGHFVIDGLTLIEN